MEKGELKVKINYEKLAQDVKCAIYFLERLRDRLDVAAIEKGILERDRRNGERRKENTITSNS